ncbi:9459_t:CDS:1, partial [Racocetra persica]
TLSSEVAEQSTIHTELLESSENSSDEEDYASDASNVSEVDLTTTSIWKEQPITIDQRAIQLTYNRPCRINLPSVSLSSPFTIFSRFLPMNYIEQNIVRSINLLGRKNNLNWIDININEYKIWLELWVLMSIVPVSDRRYYWRTQENTQPLMPFNFQRWMSMLRFEQIVSQHTLMMPHELEITNHNDCLFS